MPKIPMRQESPFGAYFLVPRPAVHLQHFPSDSRVGAIAPYNICSKVLTICARLPGGAAPIRLKMR